MPFEMDSTISIHAPARGGDTNQKPYKASSRYFNPRPPRGGRLHPDVGIAASGVISIHAPREGGDCSHTYQQETTQISIHAPREGGDFAGSQTIPPAKRISIHAPREGGDNGVKCVCLRRSAFQSTPPARGATTTNIFIRTCYILFQSTPPARGATSSAIFPRHSSVEFQSTPPARGATASLDNKSKDTAISIHAPREGGDNHRWLLQLHAGHFNPRPPRGGRRRRSRQSTDTADFNPRPPRGGRLQHRCQV